MRTVVLAIQCATYVVLGLVFCTEGKWKLGVAQLLLAVVQGAVFS